MQVNAQQMTLPLMYFMYFCMVSKNNMIVCALLRLNYIFAFGFCKLLSNKYLNPEVTISALWKEATDISNKCV